MAKNAPVEPLEKETGTEFTLIPEQVATLRKGFLALRDFRHISIPSMRAMHDNYRVIQNLIKTKMTPEEELIGNISNALYGEEAHLLTPEERVSKRAELDKISKSYATKGFKVTLHTIPESEFTKALENPENFTKRQFQEVGEVDTLVSYFDLCSEGIIV